MNPSKSYDFSRFRHPTQVAVLVAVWSELPVAEREQGSQHLLEVGTLLSVQGGVDYRVGAGIRSLALAASSSSSTIVIISTPGAHSMTTTNRLVLSASTFATV
jgi:hypothetical protein